MSRTPFTQRPQLSLQPTTTGCTRESSTVPASSCWQVRGIGAGIGAAAGGASVAEEAYGVDKGPVYEDGNEDDGHVFSRIARTTMAM